jgi:hypothetical protein
MKASKHIMFVAIFVLVTGLIGVMAQNRTIQKDSAIRLPPEPILQTAHVTAAEITDGIVGFDSQTKKETVFGYSFLGQTTGSYPGSFTLSMNCSPAIPIPGDVSEMSGGAWTLPVYVTGTKATGHAGSLYGTISKGTMSWDKAGTTATIYAVLNVDGGTQKWSGAQGFVIFTGTLSVDGKTQEPTLDGDLVFTMFNFIIE